MKTFKFRIKATVTKIETVEIDTEGLSEDEAEEQARQQAHEQFSVLNDGDEESYTEDSEIIID